MSSRRLFALPFVVLGAISLTGAAGGCDNFFTVKDQSGVHIGSTEAEVQKVFGPPIAESPNFGRPQKFYKAASGKKYMIIYEDGKVVEIH